MIITLVSYPTHDNVGNVWQTSPEQIRRVLYPQIGSAVAGCQTVDSTCTYLYDNRKRFSVLPDWHHATELPIVRQGARQIVSSCVCQTLLITKLL